jgi:hypothetical protein
MSALDCDLIDLATYNYEKYPQINSQVSRKKKRKVKKKKKKKTGGEEEFFYLASVQKVPATLLRSPSEDRQSKHKLIEHPVSST